MYLIRRKSDKTVEMVFGEKPRMGKYLKYPVMAYNITPDTHEVVQDTEMPADFQPGIYRHDKGWVKTGVYKKPEKKVDPKIEALKELKEAKAEAKGKNLSMAYLDKRLEALEKYLGVI